MKTLNEFYPIKKDDNEPFICYYSENCIKVDSLISILRAYPNRDVCLCEETSIILHSNQYADKLFLEMGSRLENFPRVNHFESTDSGLPILMGFNHTRVDRLIPELQPFKDRKLVVMGEEGLKVYISKNRINIMYWECSDDYDLCEDESIRYLQIFDF